jgi:hypothetical protein
MSLVEKQMDQLDKADLQMLFEQRQDVCISLYMPTHHVGADIQQEPIRLKNLLSAAESQLAALGKRTPEIRQLLAPARALIDNRQFWQHQSEGLALFLAPDYFASYRLPAKFEEIAVAGNRFYIKPLLPVISGEGEFYVLALSQDEARFFHGTRYTMSAVELPNVPTSLAEALRYDEFENQLQFHAANGQTTAAGERPSMFHGQGNAGDEAILKDQLRRFFGELDHGVRDLIGGQQLPLILAGLDYQRGAYREVNQYRYLVDQAIEHDGAALSAEELHEKAWAIVAPLYQQERQQAIDAFQHLAGTGDTHATNMVEQIVPAAYFQGVATLLMAAGAERWGAFDPIHNTLEIRDGRLPGDEDLLDFAAVYTLLNGGAVHIVDAQMMPAGGSPLGAVAAILRYELSPAQS